MPRTLPWLKNGTTTSAPAAGAKPRKRQRMLDPGSDLESTTLPRTIALPTKPAPPLAKKQTALRASERSPSTSPPPEPPTEEPMHPGLSADDIYIMVEDEFLSVARTFTAHLHHAEYVRLKNEAKNRNSATVSNISRPVDSITIMRAETKKKKEAEAQEARTKAGLESIKGPKRPVTASDGSDLDENEGQEQPWEGTHLQRFMTTSPKKALTSLTGLQGVTSHTRAAAGYERSEHNGKTATTRQSPTALQSRGQGKATAPVANDETSEDDDDLDAPSRAPSRAPAAASKPRPTVKAKASSPPPRPKPKAKPPSPPRPRPRRSLLDMTPLPTPTSTLPAKAPQKSQKDPDPPIVYEPVDDPHSSPSREEIRARRRRIQARKERAEKERNGSGGMMGADEIPIFLV